MKFLENKVPPLLVVLICAGTMWYLAQHTPPLPVSEPIVLAISIGIGWAGVCIMLAGVLSFRHLKTTVSPLRPDTATCLATNGIYRFTRNPMYLGMLFMLVGWGVFLASPIAFAGAVIFWLYIGRFQIQPEERALKGLFGDSYLMYASRVRRWF